MKKMNDSDLKLGFWLKYEILLICRAHVVAKKFCIQYINHFLPEHADWIKISLIKSRFLPVIIMVRVVTVLIIWPLRQFVPYSTFNCGDPVKLFGKLTLSEHLVREDSKWMTVNYLDGTSNSLLRNFITIYVNVDFFVVSIFVSADAYIKGKGREDTMRL